MSGRIRWTSILSIHQVPSKYVMERSFRSSQGDGDGKSLQWWKWIMTLLVLLSYSVVVLWIPGKFSSNQAARAVLLDDEALVRALSLSESYSTLSSACESFLLAGGSENHDAVDLDQVPIQGWSDGEWYFPSESSGARQPPRTMGGSVGKHGTSFSLNPASRGWLGRSSGPKKTPIQTVEGVLELQNFWDWNPSIEAVMLAEASGVQVDFKQMLATQNLRLSMKGAFVETPAGRRLYMTGCAYRIDRSYQIDCGFNLKMTYPSRQATLPSEQIEAELSRTTTGADDPLRFPTIRIHPDIFNAEYTSKVTYLRSVVEQETLNYNAHLRRPSAIDVAEPENLLEDFYDDSYSGYH